MIALYFDNLLRRADVDPRMRGGRILRDYFGEKYFRGVCFSRNFSNYSLSSHYIWSSHRLPSAVAFYGA